MWLENYGDISSWSYAPKLGKIVYTHSTLSLPVIAVLLGIPTEEVEAARVPKTPPWTFEGPDDNRYELSRKLTEQIND